MTKFYLVEVVDSFDARTFNRNNQVVSYVEADDINEEIGYKTEN